MNVWTKIHTFLLCKEGKPLETVHKIHQWKAHEASHGKESKSLETVHKRSKSWLSFVKMIYLKVNDIFETEVRMYVSFHS